MSRLFLIPLVLLHILSWSCSSGHNTYLDEINQQCDSDTTQALALLRTIDPSSLSEADCHYYDLLTVKTYDKAYIEHTSDSLIKTAINYYSSEGPRELYAEALYYGGRVNSDLGDYPSALQYYQSALEELPHENKNLHFRATIYSNIGYLLSEIRVYDQATIYVSEAVHLDSIINDRRKLMLNTSLLGDIYFKREKYDSAVIYFSASRELAKSISSSDLAMQDLMLAFGKFKTGRTFEALNEIRPVMGKTTHSYRNLSLAVAAQIYKANNLSDSAKLYALELIHSNQKDNKRIGYDVLLSSPVKETLSADSVWKFTKDYAALTEEYLNSHDAESALVQNSLYNYSRHLKEKEEVQKRNTLIISWLLLAVILVIGLVLIILLLKHRQTKKLLELHEALDRLRILEKSMNSDNTITQLKGMEEDSPKALRKTLFDLLKDMSEAGKKEIRIDQSILESSLYQTILNHIKGSKIEALDVSLWPEIEALVLQASPEFRTRIYYLGESRLKLDEYHMALLIKCGFNPNETGGLLGKSKGAQSYCRNGLRKHVFMTEIELKDMDCLVRML